MNKLPIPVCTHIYDFLSGDAVYWKTEFNKVIQYLDKYSDAVISDMDRVNMYKHDDYIDLYILKYFRISFVIDLDL